MSASQEFVIQAAVDDSGGLEFRLQGDLDMSTAPALAAALDDPAVAGTVTLDLGDVTFIDSSALVVLVTSGRGLADRGGRLRIGTRSEVVAKVLEITRLDQESEAFDVLPDPA